MRAVLSYICDRARPVCAVPVAPELRGLKRHFSYLQYGVTGGDLIVQRSNVLTLFDVWHVNQDIYNSALQV